MPASQSNVINVLLVEDNDADALLVELMLDEPSSVDLVLTRARTLADALEEIDSSRPDCVLLDLGLPDAQGLESVHQIKAASPLLAIVVFAGDQDDAIGTLAVAAGAQDHLVKGSTVAETLARAIRYAVVRKQCENALHRNQQTLAEAQQSHQALHDALTGVPNRAVLLDRLRQSLGDLRRRPTSIALLFIDVDRFKIVNDSLGHEAGDQILVALSNRLLANLRPGDTLARFGGDEFTMLCEDLTGEGEAVAIAERVAAAMRAPLVWDDGELIMTVSIGIVITDRADTSPESLLRDADAAMCQAKDEGRSRNAVFVEPMRTRLVSRLETEVSLRQALTEQQLEVHYQPMVALPSGTLVGTEALVRWRHPTRGLVPPDEFIPIAEETGLIVPLGAWVLKEAAQQTKAWQHRPGCSDLTVAVNLSAVQLEQADLVDLVAETLEETGLAPSSLELEITESVLMDDAARAVGILQSLKALGVRLSVDDFGTGYSSLSYLKRFPVNAVKIDRTFVSGLGVDPADTAIVHAVVSLADALGLESIAEGVETELHLDQLVELGCTYAQGFHFARPQPPNELVAHLDELARPAAHLASAAATAAAEAAATSRVWSIVRAANREDRKGRSTVATLEHPGPPPAERLPLDRVGEAVLRATRQLMWIATPADAAVVASELITALGATVVPAADAPSHALSVDVSFGDGRPRLPIADPSSVATMLLERHLPGFMVDAHRAVEFADRTHRLGRGEPR